MLELGNVCDLYLYEDQQHGFLIMVEIIMFIIMIL